MKQNKPRKQTTPTIKSDLELELDADNNETENLNFTCEVLLSEDPEQ